jgi:Calcineurin-like phosphoesterase
VLRATCYVLRSYVVSLNTRRTNKKMLSMARPLVAGLHGNPAPAVVHAKLLGALSSKSRLIIVGDVHGCLDELKSLLHLCSYCEENDKLIFVGDLVNKGPSSAGVVKFVRSIGAQCVRGNHDDSALHHALNARNGGQELPLKYQYLKDLDM